MELFDDANIDLSILTLIWIMNEISCLKSSIQSNYASTCEPTLLFEVFHHFLVHLPIGSHRCCHNHVLWEWQRVSSVKLAEFSIELTKVCKNLSVPISRYWLQWYRHMICLVFFTISVGRESYVYITGTATQGMTPVKQNKVSLKFNAQWFYYWTLEFFQSFEIVKMSGNALAWN